ncbi:unnamed protein product [Caenorhabditis brenneri]
MSLFPLWRLPALARANVLRQLDPVDIIYFSMSSRKVRWFLTSFKLYSTKLTFLFYTSQANVTLDVIKMRLDFVVPDHYAEFHFGDSICKKRFPNAKISEGKYLVLRNKYSFSTMNADSTPSKMEGMKEMCSYLLSIMFVNSFAVVNTAPIQNFNVFNCFVFDIAKRFLSVTVMTKEHELYKAEDVEAFFKNIVVTGKLYLDIRLEEPGSLTNISLNHTEEVFIPSCFWLPVESFMKINNKKCIIEYPVGSSVIPDLLDVVKGWQNGEAFENIEEMKLCYPQIDQNRVLDQVDLLDDVIRTYKRWPESSREIKRKTDGRWAHLYIMEKELGIKILPANIRERKISSSDSEAENAADVEEEDDFEDEEDIENEEDIDV